MPKLNQGNQALKLNEAEVDNNNGICVRDEKNFPWLYFYAGPIKSPLLRF